MATRFAQITRAQQSSVRRHDPEPTDEPVSDRTRLLTVAAKATLALAAINATLKENAA